MIVEGTKCTSAIFNVFNFIVFTAFVLCSILCKIFALAQNNMQMYESNIFGGKVFNKHIEDDIFNTNHLRLQTLILMILFINIFV